MKHAVSLMYHDTYADGDVESSGRCGVGPNLYKVDVARFRQQIEGLRSRHSARLSRVDAGDDFSLFVTFDDGGVSAFTQAAAVLEENDALGHFFVTSDYIGEPRFLSEDQIRELDSRGHVIGSHSKTHPDVITALTYRQMIKEWGESKQRLEQLLGHPVVVASIPGGEYNKDVVRAAGEVGIKYLFTSEPVTHTWNVGDCLALGRFTVMQDTPNEVVFEFASETPTSSQRRQTRSWYAKKLVKRICGPLYGVARDKLLTYRRAVQ